MSSFISVIKCSRGSNNWLTCKPIPSIICAFDLNKMAKEEPIEIPSLKLNDGTSIPLVSQYALISSTTDLTWDLLAWLRQLVSNRNYMHSNSSYFTAGTAWYKSSTGGIDRKTVEAIKTAIKLGYYHLDSAEVYNTEPELGIAIQESGVARENLFVTTKVITNINDIPNAIDASLKNLQLGYVDL